MYKKLFILSTILMLGGCSTLTPMRTDLNTVKIDILKQDLLTAKTLEEVQVANAKMIVMNEQLDRELPETDTYLYTVTRNPGRSFASFVILPFTFFKILPKLSW